MTARLTVISWRDIPAQVVASRGRTKARIELPGRFQVAIDRAAMAAGLIGTDAYLEEWTRDVRDCSDDIESEAAAEAERLDAAFDTERLGRLVEAHGHEESR